MDLDVWNLLIFAVLFLIVDIAMFIKIILLLKKHQSDTVETLGNKLNPYLYATGAVSILMAISMILLTVIKK